MVCITATGEKYHYSSCSYLHNSSIRTTLEEAASNGYEQCSRCDPPRYISAEEYQQHKNEQSIIIESALAVVLSVPFSLLIIIIVAKINDFFGFLDSVPDWFFVALVAEIYISVLIQALRVFIIW